MNFGEVAAPRLLEHRLPVTVFVVADLAGTANSWDAGPNRTAPDLPLLDWPALVRLQERGVTLGAHSLTHRDLTRLEPDALDDEVQGCADRMEERSGRRPTVFAYPYGHRNEAEHADRGSGVPLGLHDGVPHAHHAGATPALPAWTYTSSAGAEPGRVGTAT